MKTWKYAISTADQAPDTAPILLKGTLVENLKLARELGYDAIELHTREDEEFDYEEIQKAEESGAKLAMIITGRLNTEGGCNLIDDVPYIQEAAMNRMKMYINVAAHLEANVVIGWVKGKIPSGGSREKYLRRLAKNLDELARYGAEKHVRLNIEVLNRYETNYFLTAHEVMEFIEDYKIDNLYVHLDTFHMSIEENDMVSAIHRCKGKIGYVHLADNTRQCPGRGTIDFAKVMKTLEEVGYDGYLSVECLPLPDGVTVAKEALMYLKDIEENTK